MRPRLIMVGGSGVIGTVLSRHFITRYEIASVDPVRPGVDRVTWIAGCATDLTASDLMPEDVLLFLATGKDGRWTELLRTEIQGVHHTVSLAAEVGLRRFIFASSNHVIGGHEQDLRSVDYRPSSSQATLSEVRPDSTYGVCKAFGEGFVRYAAERLNLPGSILRIGTVRLEDDIDLAVTEGASSLLPEDTDLRRRRYAATWLRHRDLLRIAEEELSATSRFRRRFAVSDNPGRFWPLEVEQWS